MTTFPPDEKTRPSNLKIGDKVILKKRYDGGSSEYEGHILVITKKGKGTYTAKDETRPDYGSITLFFNNCGYVDEFCLLSRKEQAAYIGEVVAKLKANIAVHEKEIDDLLKFESDEDEIAEKLFKIRKADTPAAIAKILKELKKSDYI